MSGLTYHAATFAALGIEPVVSPELRDAVAERERICGVAFPASVVELLSIEGARKLFFERSNNDYLPSLDNPAGHANALVLGEPARTAQGWLCVGSENQAVVRWYVRLDEGDDPPVYDEEGVTGDLDHDAPMADVPWTRITDSFSEFIRTMVAPDEP